METVQTNKYTGRQSALFSGALVSLLSRPWFWITLSVAFFVLAPVSVVYSSLFKDTSDIWGHLMGTVLPRALINTFWLAICVLIGTGLIGTSLAWFVTQYDFPGRKYFQWFLLLPLAMPTYVLGFVWIGLADFSGPLNQFFRQYNIALPEIRSLGGIVFVMSFALYPYVYLLARNAFQSMGQSTMNAAASFGMSARDRFLKVAIPMARPWIVAGLMLVLMETLADFGTVSVFNYDTFTTAIYKTWFGLFSIEGAAQLSSVLVTFVLILVLFESRLRGQKGYTTSSQGFKSICPKKMKGLAAWSVSGFCFAVLSLGFLVPLTQLLFWASERMALDLDQRYFDLLWHTVLLGILAAGLVCFVSLLMSYSVRRLNQPVVNMMTKVATMGYALPGTVLAVGVFLSMIWFDKQMIAFVDKAFGIEIGKLITGSVLAMLIAYFVRYLAVGYSPIESAMQRMTKSVEDAARVFGYRGWRMIMHIHVPIVRRGLITAFVLVLVDVMKEMPITLMTRPFGWDTFAVRIYEMTSEGEWQRAALPAVMLVLTGMIPLFLLTRKDAQPNG